MGTLAQPPEAPAESRPQPALAAALFVFLMLAAALGYLDRLALTAVSPTLTQQFDLNDENWGWVNSAFALVFFFSSVAGGAWIDRVGVRMGLMLSVAFWSLAAAGHVLAFGFWGLCFWRMMLAVGEGPGYSSLLKGSRRLLPPRLRDAGAGLVSASAVAGALVTPLVVVPLTVRFGWQAAFLTVSAISLLWIPGWCALAFGRGANLGPAPAPVRAASDEAPSRLCWSSPTVWAAGLLIFFMTPPTSFVNTFLAQYLSKTHGLTQEEIGPVMWQPFLAADVGQLAGAAGVYLLLRRGWTFLASRRLVLATGLLGASVILAANGAADAAVAVWWVNVSRFFFMAAHTAALTYASEVAPEGQTAFVMGIMNAVFAASTFAVNPILGRLADSWGYAPVMQVLAGSPLIGLACWLVLTRLHARPARTTSTSGASAFP